MERDRPPSEPRISFDEPERSRSANSSPRIRPKGSMEGIRGPIDSSDHKSSSRPFKSLFNILKGAAQGVTANSGIHDHLTVPGNRPMSRNHRHRSRSRSRSITESLRSLSQGRSSTEVADSTSRHPSQTTSSRDSIDSVRTQQTMLPAAAPPPVNPGLRHRELPVTSEPADVKERFFLRVYRENGTFGTVVCTPQSTTQDLLQLAARKFFIEDSDNYNLAVVFPQGIRYLADGDFPVSLMRRLLFRCGFTDRDKITDVCRDDVSFLCRIVLTRHPLRPPRQSGHVLDSLSLRNHDGPVPDYLSRFAPNITSLDLSRSAIYGIMDFTRLTTLKIDQKRLRGSELPPFFSDFAHSLKHLSMKSNHLDEDIDLSNFVNLETLDLRANSLKQVPSRLPQSLRSLYIGSNAIEKLVFSHRNLKHLDASYNLLQEADVNLPKLEVLRLSHNQMNQLPATESFSRILELDVRYNQISDFLPVANLPSLVILRATGNISVSNNKRPVLGFNNAKKASKEMRLRSVELRDVMNLEIVDDNSMRQVTRLDLTGVKIPSEQNFSGLVCLESLRLDRNNLTRMPLSITKLEQLRELGLSNNSLVGLPLELLELRNLEILDVHSNNIKQLPQIWGLPKLRKLNISSNLLQLLPAHPGPPAGMALTYLYAADNRLAEDCFDDITMLANLEYLNLTCNSIAEVPPDTFLRLVKLRELHISGNRLSTLPHEDFEHAENLQVLHAAGNNLHTLPAELAKASNLEVLDVSANNLRYNVSNWPFDWSWCFNKKLRQLSLASNRRLEIRGETELCDFSVLPNLNLLSLVDVTLTVSGVPEQTENCRVRTYGSELSSRILGVAGTLYKKPLEINDLVVDRFRGLKDEVLIGMFDGHGHNPEHGGNKMSHLVQENFVSEFKQQLDRLAPEETPEDALRRSFLAVHREIGNTVLLSPEEIPHTHLGHHSPAVGRFTAEDCFSGTGAAVLYVQGSTLWLASLGGTHVVVCKASGEFQILYQPSLDVASLASSRIWVDEKGLILGRYKWDHALGCYPQTLSAAPFTLRAELDPDDVVVLANDALWEFISPETMADLVLSESHDPMRAALKLRDFALAYGLHDAALVMVLSPRNKARENSRAGSSRRELPEDSALARLGMEVAPPQGDVTMVFTDIRSSTQLWETMPGVMREAIKVHNAIMRRTIRLLEGYEVKTEGDAFIVSFHSPVAALSWCLTVQSSLLKARWPQKLLEAEECLPVHNGDSDLIFRGLRVRMGIHYGTPVSERDPITRRMDYFGPMVNRTARISGTANGGQIAVSAEFLTVIRQLEQQGEVPTQPYVVEELGEMKLRGIENVEHIHILYPERLSGRSIFFPADDETVRAIPEYPSLAAEAALQQYCHRLEALCSAKVSGEPPENYRLQARNEPILRKEIYVTRIENAVAALTNYM